MSVNKITLIPGMPSLAAVYKRRRSDNEFRARLDAILHDVRRERETRTAAALRLVLNRQDPEFVRRMVESLSAWRSRPKRPIKKQSARSKPAGALGRLPIGEHLNTALLRNELWASADAVVPAHLDQATRKDIAADIVLAILEGELSVADLPQSAKEYSRRHWKLFGRFGVVSLDAPICHGSKLTIGDSLSAEAGHFWL